MKTKFYLFILSIFAFVSCEGSRSARMIDNVEHAIDSHNNGDSTELIVYIIGGLVIGGLWLWKRND